MAETRTHANIPEDSMPYGNGSSIPAGTTAFLTHEPLASVMAGFRPRTVGAVDSISGRSRTAATDNRTRMAVQFSPFLLRRTVTSLGELPPLTSSFTRSKSARYPGVREPIIMPRSHVSVARFYDWTEDIGDCYSVSSLYRDIASIPKSQASKSRVNLNISPGSVGGGTNGGPLLAAGSPNRVAVTNPGRMFIRDKKTLTRGEREIIEGIYKNRSDLNPKEALARVDLDVKSHTEAWWAGKTLIRGERLSNGKPVITLPGTEERILIKSGNSSEDAVSGMDMAWRSKVKTNSASILRDESPARPDSHTPHKSKFLRNRGHRKVPDLSPRVTCAKCQYAPRENSHDMLKRTLQAHSQDGFWDAGPEAPPSTPDTTHNHRDSPPATSRLQPLFDTLMGDIHSNDNSSSASSSGSIPQSEKKSPPISGLSKSTKSHQSILQNSSGKPKSNVLKIDTNKIQKTMDVIYSVLEEDTKISSKSAEIHHSPLLSPAQIPDGVASKSDSGRISHVSTDEHESGDVTETDAKKVKVKVYLPTAHNDEDDLESISSSSARLQQLSKERPLSHNEYHAANKRAYNQETYGHS